MAKDNQFIEDNKEVLIEEMASSINSMNAILSAVLEQPIQGELDGALMRTYMMAMATHVGSLSTLFNQYYVLLKGVIQRDERPTGFASLIKHAEVKPHIGKDDEEDEEADE